MRDVSHVKIPKSFEANDFIDESYDTITPGRQFRPYILPGKSGNSKFHFSTSEGIDGIVDEIHIKTEEAFCFLPKNEKVDLVSKMAEAFLEYNEKYGAEIARTIMHVPARKIAEYHVLNQGMHAENVNDTVIYASVKDWNTEWRRASDNASRTSKLIATGAIVVASIGSCYLFSESFPFEAILGIGGGTFMVGVPLISTKKSRALKKIGKSEIYISLC